MYKLEPSCWGHFVMKTTTTNSRTMIQIDVVSIQFTH